MPEKRTGWGRTTKTSHQGDGVVRCDSCEKRKVVILAEVMRVGDWPVCHGEVMRLLSEDEIEEIRAREGDARDEEEDEEVSTDG